MSFDQFRNRTRWAFAGAVARARALLTAPSAPPARQLDLVELEERVLMNAVPAAVIVQSAEPPPVVTVEIEAAVIADLRTSNSTPADSAQAAANDSSAIDFTIVANSSATSLTTSASDAGTTETAADVAAVNPQAPVTEVAFVDASAADHEQFVADLNRQREAGRRIDVVVLDSRRDGIAQIGETLAQYQNLDAVHLVTHGSGGSLKLGSTWLSADSLAGYAGDIARWGQSFSAHGDLLLYGCELGATSDGLTLIDAISSLTGADVAASANNTGTSQLGADWNLEVAVGHVESEGVFTTDLQANWYGLLDTYAVTSSADSGAGSLRQAILDANAHAGTDTIEFHLAGSSVHTIQLLSALPTITDTVVLDATTQTGYAGIPLVELDGSLAGSGVNGLVIQATGSTVRGLAIGGFSGSGLVLNSSLAQILDNRIGVHANGVTSFANGSDGILVTGSGNTIGSSSNGNVIAGNAGSGIRLTGSGASNNTIAGNKIGASSNSVYAVANQQDGIRLEAGAANNLIGGVTSAVANVIAGNVGNGILLTGSGTSSNQVLSNYIGTNASSAALGNSGDGINIANGATSNSVGAGASSSGNVIRNNSGAGVVVTSSTSTGNSIRGNAISTNAGLGIDLGDDGIDAVDALDADTGPNLRQNTPEILSVTDGSTQTVVRGRFEGAANSSITLDFYSTSTPDASGTGEGESYLGSTSITTDASGTANYSFSTTSLLSTGAYVTTTATSSADGTSEFSTAVSRTDAVALTPRTETRVNSTTTSTQTTSNEDRGAPNAVAIAPDGQYAVVWTSTVGLSTEVLMRRFQADGTAITGELAVNQTTLGTQHWANVAMDDYGNGVVVWVSDTQDSLTRGVYARRFDSTGAMVGNEFLVNTTSAGSQNNPVVAMSADGAFVVAWDGQGTGDGAGIFARRYDSSGNSLGNEFRVNTTTSGTQTGPGIAMSASGNFVVVWSDNSGVHGQRYGTSGSAAGAEFLIESSSNASDAVVGMAGDGSFVVAWQRAASDKGVYMRRYGANGTSLGAATLVNADDTGDQGSPSISVSPNGDFVVTWEGKGVGDTSGVYARRFSSNGTGLTGDLRINATTSNNQEMASVAVQSAGNFVVVWSGEGSGDSSGVFVRQYGLNTTTSIQQTATNPAIDGVADTNWADVPTRNISLVNTGTISNSADLSATWQAQWDNTNLYILVNVTDDALIGNSGNSGTAAFNDDIVELYLDPDYSHFSAYDGVNDYHLGFRVLDGVVADTTLHTGANSVTSTTGIQFQTATQAGGYITEIAVPWSLLGVTPTTSTLFGLDVQVADDDDSGLARDGRLAWNTATDTAHTDTSTFGSASLSLLTTTNTLPQANAGGSYTINEGSSLSLDASGSADSDGDTLTYAWDLNLDGVFGDVVGVSPTVSWSQLGAFGITNNVVSSVGVQVDDGRGGVTTGLATLTINNLAPSAANDSGIGFTTDEDTVLVTGSATANDSDPNSNDTPTVTVLDTTGTVGSVTNNGDGTFKYNANGKFDSLAAGSQATDTFSYTISDGDGGTSTATVTITINGRNDAPSIGNGTLNNIAEGTINPPGDTVSNLFGSTFTDADAGASVSGIAVIGNSASPSSGAWQYSSNGTNWFNVGTVGDDSTALTIGTSSRLRFVPATGFSGTPTALQVRAIDNSYAGTFSTTNSGENRAFINTSTPGGTTAISANSGTLGTWVTPTVTAAQFLLSTAGDVSGSGAPGLGSWQSGEVLVFGDPSFGSGSNTSGTFSSYNNFGSGLNIDAVYYVSRSITVGSGANTFNLQPGDVLFSTDSTQSFGGLLNTIIANKDDVIVFRPTLLGSLLGGDYYILLDNLSAQHGGTETRSISLVEKDTVVGDTTVQAGSFLLTRDGATQSNDVLVFQATGVGSGTTTGTTQVLIEGDDIGISASIQGLHLLVAPQSLAGQYFAEGTLLVTVSASDTVGTNGLTVDNFDVFALNATTTTLTSGTATATTTLLFDGSDVGLNQASEAIDALALIPNSLPPIVTLPSGSVTYTEGNAPIAIKASATVSDLDSANLDTGTLTVQISGNATVDDRLTIRDDGLLGINLSGNAIYSVLSQIGTFSGGTGTTPLQITFNANATPALAQALLRNVSFSNVSIAPSQLTRTISVKLTDGDGGVSDIATTTVNVVGINSDPTVSGTASASTLEDTPLSYSHSALLALIGANDIDNPSSDLTITINNVTNGSVSLSGGSGGPGTTFTFTPTLNSVAAITFNYSVQDGVSSSSIGSGTITLTAVNDAPLLALAGNVMVNEDSGSVSISNQATASAGGGSDETSQIAAFNVNFTNASLFAVGPSIDSTGKLTFQTQANAFGTSTVTISATDNGGTANGGSNTSADQTLVITIAAQNDTPTANNVSFTLPENSSNGTTVGTVTAADIDGDLFTFSIAGGNTNGAFAINSATGVITVANSAALDFEAQSVFNLSVEARDPSNAVATAAVTINLTDVNETPSASGFTTTLTENSANGTTVGSVTASDPDGNALTFSITGGNTGGAFAINSTTGAITVAKSSALNFESQSVFNLTVKAQDPSNASATTTVTVNLSDLNETPTVSGFSRNLAENSTVGTSVGTVTSSDPDGDALTFSIVGGNTNGAFAINSSTGAITVANSAALNFEAQSAFGLTIKAQDPDGAFDTATATVNLSDVNDTPTASGFSATLPENSAAGTQVGIVTGADQDGDLLQYSIIGGNTGGAFSINLLTGRITVNDPSALDFEAQPSFNLAVRVHDLSNAFTTTTVIVNLTDLNEAPNVTGFNRTLAENTTNGTSVGTVTSSDQDGDALTFSIVGGNSNGAFAINSATGEITVANAAALNFESQSKFNLTIKAQDPGNASDTATVTVNLTDVNETPTANGFSTTLAENSSAGTTVGFVTGTDPDGDSLQYSITGGNTGGAFAINASTGRITVASSAALDFETQSAFNLTVQVRDPDNAFVTTTVAVNVSDVNEAPAVNGFSTTLAENSTIGTSIGAVTFSDPDSDLLSFTIVGGNLGGAFVIDSATGVIRVANAAAVNFETHPSFSLTVRASDGNGGLDTATVSVALADQNETPIATGLTTAVQENLANGTFVGKVTGADPDGDTLSYAITGGNTSNAFVINTATGVIRVLDSSLLDFESTSQFNLAVTVSDTQGLTTTVAATVSLTNQNEAPSATGFTTTLTENTANNTILGAPSGTDPDGNTLSWSIVNGNTFGAFAINSTTGAIRVANSAALSFEAQSQFTLVVRAQDTGGLGDTASVIVHLTDVNEAPTVISPHGNTNGDVFVFDDVANGATVTTLVATDPDLGDVLTWSLTAGDPNGVFALDTQSGRLTVADASTLDSATQPQFQLTIQVADQQGLTQTITLVVNVTPPVPVVVLPLSTSLQPRLAPQSTSEVPESTSGSAASTDTTAETTNSSTADSVAIVAPPTVTGESTNAAPEAAAAEEPVAATAAETNAAVAVIAQTLESEESAARSSTSTITASISQAAPNGSFRDSLDSARASLRFDGEDLSYVVDTRFLQGLREAEQNAALDAPAKRMVIGTAVATSAGLSVGYIVWMIRGGYLLASVLSTAPAWQYVDPLPVLSALEGDDEDDESLEALIENAEDQQAVAT